MSFTVTTHEGMTETHWYTNVDALIASMLANPNNRYWRNK